MNINKPSFSDTDADDLTCSVTELFANQFCNSVNPPKFSDTHKLENQSFTNSLQFNVIWIEFKAQGRTIITETHQ